MAPEVTFTGKNYNVEKSDVYSIGHIFYSLLTLDIGKNIDFKREKNLSLLNKIMESNYTYKEIYFKLIKSCLSYKPDERPTSSKLFNEISFYFDQFKIKFHDSFINDNVSDKNSEVFFFLYYF
jgi:serine/threonine protein kinase